MSEQWLAQSERLLKSLRALREKQREDRLELITSMFFILNTVDRSMRGWRSWIQNLNFMARFSEAELRDAELNLTNAQIRLTERKERVSAGAGEFLQRLAERLAETRIERAELKAKAAYAHHELVAVDSDIKRANETISGLKDDLKAIHPYAVVKGNVSAVPKPPAGATTP